MRLILILILATGCSSLTVHKTSSHSPQFQVNVLKDSGGRAVASQGTSKKILVKKCLSSSTCEEKTLEFSQFSQNLQKKILVRSVISQQISLLEQQAASLRLDRDSLQQEISQMSRDLKMNRMSTLHNVKINTERLREQILLEVQDVEKKLALTEKDLQVLKDNSQSSSVAKNSELAKILAILETQSLFGQSLQYKDNLIAQTVDAVVSEMI